MTNNADNLTGNMVVSESNILNSSDYDILVGVEVRDEVVVDEFGRE